MDHQKATRRGRADYKHARGGRTVHIFDICDGAEFAEFLGQAIAGWCWSSGLGFAFTLTDTDMAGNIRCHSSKLCRTWPIINRLGQTLACSGP